MDASFHSIAQLGRLYASGAVSPVEVTRAMLERIERIDPHIHSYLTVTGDLALEQARRAETAVRSGGGLGPLQGIPYAAKDIFFTKGIRTTAGSKILADFMPDYDAAAIEKLNACGAVMLGKTGLHEWAYGITSANPHFGPVRNPWDTERIPGGSSGGSTAALAAGLCAFSLGSDTGGSIRIPAAFCAVTGLKPTFGRISRYGVFPLGHTLDTVGPFARTVEDAARVYEALAGPDGRGDSAAAHPPAPHVFSPEPSLKGKRIGIPRNFYFDGLAPDVETACRRAVAVLADLGAELVEIAVPDIESYNLLHRLILLAEASSVHAGRLRSRRADFGEDVGMLLDQGLFVTATDYLNAQRKRRGICRDFNRLFETVDAVATPAAPTTAARIGQLEIKIQGKMENVRLAATRNIRALNLTGLPLLAVPCGFGADGLPIGLQIAAPLFDEGALFDIGHAYQLVTDWHMRKPPIAA